MSTKSEAENSLKRPCRNSLSFDRPLFGMVSSWDCDRSIGYWRTGELRLRHRRDDGRIEVATVQPDQPAADRQALARWMRARAARDSELVFPVELRAERWEADVPIDDAAVPFVFIGDEMFWFAWAEHAHRRVELDCHGVDYRKIALATVDLAAYTRR